MLARTISHLMLLARFLVAMLVGLILAGPTHAQSMVPEGILAIEDFGADAQLILQPTASTRRLDAYLVLRSGPCLTASRLHAGLCETLAKEGPQVRHLTLDYAPPRLGGSATIFAGMLDFAGVSWPVRLFWSGSEWLFSHTDASVAGSPAIQATRVRQLAHSADRPAAQLAGNWQADFGSTRIDAILSATETKTLEGTFNIHPGSSANRYPPGTASEIWPEWMATLEKVAVDSGSFSLNYTADSTGAGRYSGRAEADPALGQNGWIRLLPAGSDLLVIEVAGDLDSDPPLPFLLSRTSGPLTPIAGPGESQAGSLDGRWQNKGSVVVQHNGQLLGLQDATLTISDDATQVVWERGQNVPITTTLTVWRGDVGNFLLGHVGHVRGPDTVSARDWVGSPVRFATFRPRGGTDSALLIAGEDRALVVISREGGDVYTDVMVRNEFHEAVVLFLERQGTAAMPMPPALPDGELPGHWVLEGSSLTHDLVIDPLDASGTYPAYLVVSAGPGPIYPCPAGDMPALPALCERIEKGFPVVFSGALRASPQGSISAPIYTGSVSADWTGFGAVDVVFSPNAAHTVGLFSTQAQYSPYVGRRMVPVQARKVEDKFTPDSTWANGNWFYDDGAVRFELGLNARGPVQLSGTALAVPPGGDHFLNSRNPVLGDLEKVVVEQGGMTADLVANLGQLGSFFEGTFVPRAGDEARIRIMPVENNALVILLDDSTSGAVAPFAMMRMDGGLSPVPPAPPPPTPMPQPGPGRDGAQQVCPASGSWQARYGGAYLRFLNEDAGLLPLSLSVTEALNTSITAPGLTDSHPAFAEADDFGELAIAAADALGTLSGQSASAWLGSGGQDTPTIVAHKTNGNPPLVLVAGCERAILITNGPGSDVYADLISFGRAGTGARLFFLERTSALPNAATRPESAGQVGAPTLFPATGAAGLLWAADVTTPCRSLMALEDALWAGAVDGNVDHGDLRALSKIMYPAGVGGTGLSNDGQCASILSMLQAEMAQRNPQ